MFVLNLNPILGNQGELVSVLTADTKEELIAEVELSSVEMYSEDVEVVDTSVVTEEGQEPTMKTVTISKHFKKGNVLENFNPPAHFDDSITAIPSKQEYLETMAISYDSQISNILAGTTLIGTIKDTLKQVDEMEDTKES